MKAPKRFVVVITTDDPENDICSLSAAATWINLALGKDAESLTVYATAADAAIDEQNSDGEFRKPAGTILL